MIITADQGIMVNRETATMQKVGLGTEVATLGAYASCSIPISIAADATGNLDTLAPFAFELIDVTVQGRAASGSGAVTVKKATNAVTDAIAMSTNNAITRAGTIDKTYSTFAEGDTIRLTTVGANDRGLVTLFVKRSA